MKDYIFIRKNQRFERIDFSELLYVKGMRTHMLLVTAREVFFVFNTMEQVQRSLPVDRFVRINKSYIVNMDHIRSFTLDWVCLAGLKVEANDSDSNFIPALARETRIRIGKTYRNILPGLVPNIPNKVNPAANQKRNYAACL